MAPTSCCPRIFGRLRISWKSSYPAAARSSKDEPRNVDGVRLIGPTQLVGGIELGGSDRESAAAGSVQQLERAPSAEQLTHAAISAEVARVQALSDGERNEIGKRYTDPEELFLALEAGGGNATLILRASWVMKQRGGRLPKRGDTLPPEATITVAELRAIAKASKCEHGALPVIALSHFWRTKEHPDPDGETLELVVSALEQRWEEFTRKGVTDLGLIIDWCALWQAPRTPEQAAIFSFGLKGINLVRSSPSPILTCCAAGHSITRFTFSRLAYARSGMRIEAQQCGSSPPVLTVSRASRTGTRAGRRLNTPSRCSSSRRTRRA